MLSRKNLLQLLAAAVVISLLIVGCGSIPVQLPEVEPPGEGEVPPEQPAPTEPPPAEPEPTEPPPAEPEPTKPPSEPGPEEPPPAEPPPPEQGGMGNLLLWGILGAVALAIGIGLIAALVRGFGKGEEAPPELPSVPITTVAEDIKEGRVSKIVVSGEELTITRLDGLMMVSHKEPTADLVQLLTNLGVTPEMLSKIIIEVETPES